MAAIKKIANFAISGHLGKGGMGDVYKAVQQPLGRDVALKVLFNHQNDDKAVSRFETEARAISKLQHNNIVSLYDYGIENGLNYFAMQYVEGKDLNTLLQEKRQLGFKQIIDITRQISRGLLYAHSAGIIHRDIKPHNILLDSDENCYISDFGIARIFRESGVTQTGVAIGTPEYMSPEQAQGKSLDSQTDVYSLGTLMYEMVTGIPPFSGKNAVGIAYKQVHEHPKPPSKHRPDVPKRLELIILKALKKSKKERYRSIEGILNDLDTVVIAEKTGLFKAVKPSKPEVSEPDTRITDRRAPMERRTENNRRDKVTIFSFIGNTLKNQWLSLILIAILYVHQFWLK
jgi:serine/threonine protein kinase